VPGVGPLPEQTHVSAPAFQLGGLTAFILELLGAVLLILAGGALPRAIGSNRKGVPTA
jgi:hypothetical protein